MSEWESDWQKAARQRRSETQNIESRQTLRLFLYGIGLAIIAVFGFLLLERYHLLEFTIKTGDQQADMSAEPGADPDSSAPGQATPAPFTRSMTREQAQAAEADEIQRTGAKPIAPAPAK